MSQRPPDDLVPASVRLGNVVPPEEPEDWTRPLTWLAALGILAGPIVALFWFGLAPPASPDAPVPGTWLAAAVVAVGAALTGATQLGAVRTATASLGAALLAALLMIMIAAAMAGTRQVGQASPGLAHAVAAALAGLAGALAAAGLGPALAGIRSRGRRFGVPALVAVAVSALVVPLLFRS